MREIIVTGVSKSANGDLAIAAVFWLTAPANGIVPKPNATSSLPASATVSWGITPTELAALQAGTVIEQTYVTGQISGPTMNVVKAALQTAYTAAQAASDAANPAAKFIGSFWDGTTWTAAP